MQKSTNMVLVLMNSAHSGSMGLLQRFIVVKKDDKLKEEILNNYDCEKVILLEEDADDYNAFDYEDAEVQYILNQARDKCKIDDEEEKETMHNESMPMKNNHSDINDYEAINENGIRSREISKFGDSTNNLELSLITQSSNGSLESHINA